MDEPKVKLHDSATGTPEPNENEFHKTVAEINRILGPSSGINSDEVDVESLQSVMRRYTSSESDWSQYAFADATRAYTRNLVDRGNGKCNLLVLVWSPGQSSPIHDHANSHCVMKILKGELTETLYDWPCEDLGSVPSEISAISAPVHSCVAAGSRHHQALTERRSTRYEANEVTYMSDSLGLHRIRNTSETAFAVSLHLYTPPNAAIHGCHIYTESTGVKHHVTQSHFYSELGIRS